MRELHALFLCPVYKAERMETPSFCRATRPLHPFLIQMLSPRKPVLQTETRSTKLKRSGSCPARPNEAGRKSCSFCPVVFLTTMNCMERNESRCSRYGPALLCVPPRLATRFVQPGDTSQDLRSSFPVRFPTDRMADPVSSFRICRRICRVVSGYRPRVSATVSRNSRMVMTEKE